MAKISNLKDTEGTEKEQEFLNCNKTMREHFCWFTGSIEQLSAQQVTYLLGYELREHDTAYFKIKSILRGKQLLGLVLRSASKLYLHVVGRTKTFEFPHA